MPPNNCLKQNQLQQVATKLVVLDFGYQRLFRVSPGMGTFKTG